MNFDDLYNDSLWAGKNLKILKDRESTLAERARRKKIEISNSHYRGLLIDRKLVEAHVINYLNVLSSQLFDTADSVSNDVLNILQTYKNQNEAVIKIKKLIIDKVSILIKDTKQIIKNNLNKIGGYDNEQK